MLSFDCGLLSVMFVNFDRLCLASSGFRNYIFAWYLLSALFDNPSHISILIEPKELVSMYLFLQFGPKTGKMSAINQIIISDKKSGGRFSTLS